MTETYGWGDTAKCGALCALSCVIGCAGLSHWQPLGLLQASFLTMKHRK